MKTLPTEASERRPETVIADAIARAHSVSKRTVTNWPQRRIIPAIRVGRVLRVVPELLDEGGGIAHGAMTPVFGSSTSTCNHVVPRSGRKAAISVVSNFRPATCAVAAIQTSLWLC